jgi:hypothetical protein
MMSASNECFLDISSSGLSELPVTGRLRSLNASRNVLKTIDYQKGWDDLRILNLSHNHLTSYNLGGLSNLRVLDISNNALSHLEIFGPPTLVEIKANENNIVSINGLHQLERLETLELAGNQLDASSFQCSLVSLKKLDIVDLSRNNLNTVDIVATNFPRSLRALFIGQNPINGITALHPIAAFQNLHAIHLDALPVFQSENLDRLHIASFLVFLLPNLCAIDHNPVRPDEKLCGGSLFRRDGCLEVDDNLLLLLLPDNEKSLVSYIKRVCGGTNGDNDVDMAAVGSIDEVPLVKTSSTRPLVTNDRNVTIPDEVSVTNEIDNQNDDDSENEVRRKSTGGSSLASFISAKGKNSNNDIVPSPTPESPSETTANPILSRTVPHRKPPFVPNHIPPEDSDSVPTESKMSIDDKITTGLVTFQAHLRGARDRKDMQDLLDATRAANKIQDAYRDRIATRSPGPSPAVHTDTEKVLHTHTHTTESIESSSVIVDLQKNVKMQRNDIDELRTTIETLTITLSDVVEERDAAISHAESIREDYNKIKQAMKYLWAEVASLREQVVKNTVSGAADTAEG